jgi:chemotaxis protein MotB
MFWLKRLKTGEDDVHWSVPLGDLMSLLLAMFVMIAAMSELKAGPHYSKVAGGVRQAFGFSPKAPKPVSAIPTSRPKTLLERLEQAAVAREGPLALDAGSDESLAPCQVARRAEGLSLRLPAAGTFDRFSGALKPAGARVLARLADYLAPGQAALEVWGYADDGPIPGGVPFRDGLDLSYQRARAVADALVRGGVDRDRLCVVAAGDRQASIGPANPPVEAVPTSPPATASSATPVSEVIVVEIFVWSAAADQHARKIAEKEQVRDGQR